LATRSSCSTRCGDSASAGSPSRPSRPALPRRRSPPCTTRTMNRELPLYLLGAMMIHGSVLWAWAKTPAAQIGTQKPPAVEIEISEEQAPAKDPAPAESIPRNEMPPPPQKTEDPVTQPESVPETEAAVTESPPIARPTPRVMPPRPVAPKPTSSPLPSVSHDRDAKAFASRPASGSGKDRSHASWKHRVTPSYPPRPCRRARRGASS